MTTNNNNDFDFDCIPLKISNVLQNEKVVQKFVKNTKRNEIIIELNHVYDKAKIIVDIRTPWLKFLHDFEVRANEKGISKDHIIMLKNNLDDEHELIIGINKANHIDISEKSYLYNQTKKCNYTKNSEIYKSDPIQKEKIENQEESKDNNIPLLSVLQAKRSSEGLKRVIGRIVGRSTNFKVVATSVWKCNNFGCQNFGSLTFYPPLLHPPNNLDNTRGSKPSCFICKIYSSINVTHEYKNAKIIQLDDIDTIEEKFDRLDVIMYDEASNHIIDGEIVEIEGDLRTQKRVDLSVQSGGSKMMNILHSDKLIVYKNKKEIKITEKDITIFYRWKKICEEIYKKEIEIVNSYKDVKKEERPDWVKKINPMTFEQRIISMFAPNVYGHADKKMGILRSMVGGSKAENGADNGRRGRIHLLMIGDPGTAKTVLASESIKLDQNSRIVDATGASGKSLVGIVDKENDSLMVKYGVVVATKNSHVVINEAGSMIHEDQWHLVGIAEEGKTSLDKWGEHIPIDAPTTLILTANPIGTKWESSKISKDKMVVIRQNLLDRMDQIYGFFDAQTEEEMEGFITEVDKITSRKPHNYNFLIKFLQYTKTIEPKLTGTTKYRLNRFWINAKLKGMASNRSFFSIKRIAEAQAKLNLSEEIDDIIASRTIQSLQLMYNQYGTNIEQIQNPRDLTTEVLYNILKENADVNHSVRELCKKASEKNKHVNGYLKKNWELSSNKELRTIVGMLEQKENIKITSLKPRILVYFTNTHTNPLKFESENHALYDLCDPCDQPSNSLIENNKE